VSPILVRPVREQLEHDRVIRLLQAKFRRRHEVGINPGAEQNTAVGTGPSAAYPDLVLTSPERRRRIEGIIEVETSESVNNLEAIGQWARLAQLRAPLHLYVPAGSVDSAKRFCLDNQIGVAEVWAYHMVGDQLRFTMAYRFPADVRAASARAARQRGAAARKAARPARPKPAPRRRAKKAAASKPTRPQKRK
jgi:hypothetical protein